MEPNEKVLREKVYEIKGTTKLDIWDDGYDQSGTELEFHGNISAAPNGKMRIREVETRYPKFTINEITVEVFQAKDKRLLDVYMQGQHIKGTVKKHYALNCETAHFCMRTKYGYDEFHTGADGVFADLWHLKQHYGMIAVFGFDADLFTFEELEERFLNLFPEQKTREHSSPIQRIQENQNNMKDVPQQETETEQKETSLG